MVDQIKPTEGTIPQSEEDNFPPELKWLQDMAYEQGHPENLAAAVEKVATGEPPEVETKAEKPTESAFDQLSKRDTQTRRVQQTIASKMEELGYDQQTVSELSSKLAAGELISPQKLSLAREILKQSRLEYREIDTKAPLIPGAKRFEVVQGDDKAPEIEQKADQLIEEEKLEKAEQAPETPKEEPIKISEQLGFLSEFLEDDDGAYQIGTQNIASKQTIKFAQENPDIFTVRDGENGQKIIAFTPDGRARLHQRLHQVEGQLGNTSDDDRKRSSLIQIQEKLQELIDQEQVKVIPPPPGPGLEAFPRSRRAGSDLPADASTRDYGEPPAIEPSPNGQPGGEPVQIEPQAQPIDVAVQPEAQYDPQVGINMGNEIAKSLVQSGGALTLTDQDLVNRARTGNRLTAEELVKLGKIHAQVEMTSTDSQETTNTNQLDVTEPFYTAADFAGGSATETSDGFVEMIVPSKSTMQEINRKREQLQNRRNIIRKKFANKHFNQSILSRQIDRSEKPLYDLQKIIHLNIDSPEDLLGALNGYRGNIRDEEANNLNLDQMIADARQYRDDVEAYDREIKALDDQKAEFQNLTETQIRAKVLSEAPAVIRNMISAEIARQGLNPDNQTDRLRVRNDILEKFVTSPDYLRGITITKEEFQQILDRQLNTDTQRRDTIIDQINTRFVEAQREGKKQGLQGDALQAFIDQRVREVTIGEVPQAQLGSFLEQAKNKREKDEVKRQADLQSKLRLEANKLRRQYLSTTVENQQNTGVMEARIISQLEELAKTEGFKDLQELFDNKSAQQIIKAEVVGQQDRNKYIHDSFQKDLNKLIEQSGAAALNIGMLDLSDKTRAIEGVVTKLTKEGYSLEEINTVIEYNNSLGGGIFADAAFRQYIRYTESPLRPELTPKQVWDKVTMDNYDERIQELRDELELSMPGLRERWGDSFKKWSKQMQTPSFRFKLFLALGILGSGVVLWPGGVGATLGLNLGLPAVGLAGGTLDSLRLSMGHAERVKQLQRDIKGLERKETRAASLKNDQQDILKLYDDLALYAKGEAPRSLSATERQERIAMLDIAAKQGGFEFGTGNADQVHEVLKKLTQSYNRGIRTLRAGARDYLTQNARVAA